MAQWASKYIFTVALCRTLTQRDDPVPVFENPIKFRGSAILPPSLFQLPRLLCSRLLLSYLPFSQAFRMHVKLKKEYPAIEVRSFAITTWKHLYPVGLQVRLTLSSRDTYVVLPNTTVSICPVTFPVRHSELYHLDAGLSPYTLYKITTSIPMMSEPDNPAVANPRASDTTVILPGPPGVI